VNGLNHKEIQIWKVHGRLNASIGLQLMGRYPVQTVLVPQVIGYHLRKRFLIDGCSGPTRLWVFLPFTIVPSSIFISINFSYHCRYRLNLVLGSILGTLSSYSSFYMWASYRPLVWPFSWRPRRLTIRHLPSAHRIVSGLILSLHLPFGLDLPPEIQWRGSSFWWLTFQTNPGIACLLISCSFYRRFQIHYDFELTGGVSAWLCS